LGSIEALVATLHREASEESGKLPNAFSEIFETDSNFYKNGYLEIYKLSPKKQKELYELLEENIDKLIILPQWAICEASGSLQLQVFSAAPSYQAEKIPKEDSIGAKICDLLVSTQYEAIAKLAVIKSAMSEEVVPVHFTLVGQGVFNNPKSAMIDSFYKIAKIVQGYDLIKVFIHGYGQKDQILINSLANKKLFNMKKISADEFKHLTI